MLKMALQVITQDGELLELQAATVNQCQTLRDIAEDVEEMLVPLDIPASVLRIIETYCVSQSFQSTDMHTLSLVVEASNFLNCTGLYMLACEAVADIIKHTMKTGSLDDIRHLFRVSDDLTDEERESIIPIM